MRIRDYYRRHDISTVRRLISPAELLTRGLRMAGRSDLIVRELLGRHGRLYAEDAGIRLADRPGPLYQLLVSLSQRAASEVTASVRD